MKYLENNYVMSITPSKQHFWMWYVLSAMIHFVIAIILIRLAWVEIVVIGAAILSYLISVTLTLSFKLPSYQLTINERGILRYREQINFNGKLLTNSFCTGWFIWLCFEREFDGQVIRLLIWPDALDNQSFRRLSRIVRLKRRLI